MEEDSSDGARLADPAGLALVPRLVQRRSAAEIHFKLKFETYFKTVPDSPEVPRARRVEYRVERGVGVREPEGERVQRRGAAHAVHARPE